MVLKPAAQLLADTRCRSCLDSMMHRFASATRLTDERLRASVCTRMRRCLIGGQGMRGPSVMFLHLSVFSAGCQSVTSDRS